MLSFIPKRITQIKQSPLFRYFNSSQTKPHFNFTVEYLINTCGFSQSAAISASQKVQFQSPNKPDAVLNLLTTYGFTHSQTSTVITKLPRLLLVNPHKTLKPKIEFLKSFGLSDIGHFLSKNPSILKSGLDNQIIPTFDFLSSILPTHHDVLLSVRRCPWIVTNRRNMKTNVDILSEHGVSQSNIAFLMKRPRLLLLPSPRLQKDIHWLKQIGLDPLRRSFADALFRTTGFRLSTLKHKSQVLTRWGWSESDILSNFKKFPQIMVTSEKKIDKVMDFVINEMGWNSGDIIKWPNIFSLSFEERLVPRLVVIQRLRSERLLSKATLSTLLCVGEKEFLDKYVYKHKDHVTELLNLYQTRKGSTSTSTGLVIATQSNVEK